MQDHTKLRVWQRAFRLSIDVLHFANQRPIRCIPDLRSQLVRSSASIAANIAEGCGCASRPQLCRYLQNAIASASELENHLMYAAEAAAPCAQRALQLLAEVRTVRAMLVTLQQKVNAQTTR